MYINGLLSSNHDSVRDGDFVTLIVDMDMNTLEYLINGESLGILMTEVPSQDVWIALYLFQEEDEVQIF